MRIYLSVNLTLLHRLSADEFHKHIYVTLDSSILYYRFVCPCGYLKGVKKIRSAIKLYCYYFSYNVPNDILSLELFKVDTLDKK